MCLTQVKNSETGFTDMLHLTIKIAALRVQSLPKQASKTLI
jgi:hypothetical protein